MSEKDLLSEDFDGCGVCLHTVDSGDVHGEFCYILFYFICHSLLFRIVVIFKINE